MLLTPNVKHILPRAIWLKNKNGRAETAQSERRKDSLIMRV